MQDRKRVVIERVSPQIEEGRYPAKRVPGQTVRVEADLFADGHDQLSAFVLYRGPGKEGWEKTPMAHLVNDRWRGSFTVEREGTYRFTLQAWVSHYATWCADLRKRLEAGQDVSVDLRIGLDLLRELLPRASDRDARRLEAWIRECEQNLGAEKSIAVLLDPQTARTADQYVEEHRVTTYDRELEVLVERPRTGFSAWYELFPRSCSPRPDRHGTLEDCRRLVPDIASMGFDVMYLPPVHPIGRTNRKGKNNDPVSGPGDPGSPWAIGSPEGGHTAVHPELGTLEDLKKLIQEAGKHGMETALDLAFQCSPDHPYVAEHPGWFRWRPDGTVQYAENPPKKYEDILPLNFECDDWRSLWQELLRVVLFWIDAGVRIFRVDNPHTKPFAFWEWLIAEVRQAHPDVFFLSEAFTRPKVMYRLAKIGFSQSYTYFTWRNTKEELVQYLQELAATEIADFFRPSFWPNTPDILPEYLQYGGRPAFITRLVLAATLSSNYGIYGPAYELCVSRALPGREEYLDSEKYEVKHWNRKAEGNIRKVITLVNRARRDNPALQETGNLVFCDIANHALLCYLKTTGDRSNIVLVAVNLDPYNIQAGMVRVPLDLVDAGHGRPFMVHDLLSGHRYMWQGERNYIELDPARLPAHLFRVYPYVHHEEDFDYFM
ncbi:MAG: alpha-1,4-glucan--maltose-1-phosphate maltosyltransferase [Spirochaetota bacterium]